MKQTTPTTIRESGSRKLFRVINTLLLALICLIFIIPIWNVLITSVAKDIDVMGAAYVFMPCSFTL